jgi:hypothetical protein
MTKTHGKKITGAEIYGQLVLFLYETIVLQLNLGFIWGCLVHQFLLPFFVDSVSPRHLDCGVATGYFSAAAMQHVRKAQLTGQYQITLVHLNPSCLVTAKRSILAAAPDVRVQSVHVDARAGLPPALKGSEFASLSMFNLLHCIPNETDKLQILRNYKELLADDGVLVGCTLLGSQYCTGVVASAHLRLILRSGHSGTWKIQRRRFWRF